MAENKLRPLFADIWNPSLESILGTARLIRPLIQYAQETAISETINAGIDSVNFILKDIDENLRINIDINDSAITRANKLLDSVKNAKNIALERINEFSELNKISNKQKKFLLNSVEKLEDKIKPLKNIQLSSDRIISILDEIKKLDTIIKVGEKAEKQMKEDLKKNKFTKEEKIKYFTDELSNNKNIIIFKYNHDEQVLLTANYINKGGAAGAYFAKSSLENELEKINQKTRKNINKFNKITAIQHEKLMLEPAPLSFNIQDVNLNNLSKQQLLLIKDAYKIDKIKSRISTRENLIKFNKDKIKKEESDIEKQASTGKPYSQGSLNAINKKIETFNEKINEIINEIEELNGKLEKIENENSVRLNEQIYKLDDNERRDILKTVNNRLEALESSEISNLDLIEKGLRGELMFEKAIKQTEKEKESYGETIKYISPSVEQFVQPIEYTESVSSSSSPEEDTKLSTTIEDEDEDYEPTEEELEQVRLAMERIKKEEEAKKSGINEPTYPKGYFD